MQVSFRKPIISFIKTHYSTSKATQLEPILSSIDESRESLRTETSGNEISSAKVGWNLVQQLSFLDVHFPINSHSIKVKLQWTSSFDPKSWDKSFNMANEILNTYLQLVGNLTSYASLQDLSTPSGIKTAYSYYSISASLLTMACEKYSERVDPSSNSDVSSPGLSFAISVFEACSQELFCRLAIVANKSNKAIASLAKGTEDAYSKIVVQIPALKLPDQWLYWFSSRILWFKSLSHYRIALDFKAEAEYGKSLGYLTIANSTIEDAVTQSKAALKSNSDLPQTPELFSLQSEITADFTELKHDNSVLYNEPILDSSQMPEQESKIMIKKNPLPDDALCTLLGQDILSDPYGDLVPPFIAPLRIYAAKSLKNHLSILSKSNNDQDELINDAYKKMDYPSALEQFMPSESNGATPGTIPKDLQTKIKRVNEAGGTKHLKEIYSALQTYSKDCHNLLPEIISILDKELVEDTEMRTRFGSKWTAQSSEKLQMQFRPKLAEIKVRISQAASTDDHVSKSIANNLSNFDLLSKPISELSNMVPPSTGSTTPDIVIQLSKLFEKSAQIKLSRFMLLKKLSNMTYQIDPQSQATSTETSTTASSTIFSKITNWASGSADVEFKGPPGFDTIIPVLLAFSTIEECTPIVDNWVNTQLSDLRNESDELYAKQNDILSKITPMYSDFLAIKESLTEDPQRAAMLKKLNDAVKVFDDSIKSISGGIEFYLATQENLTSFLADVNDWVYVRNLERSSLLGTLVSHPRSRIEPNQFGSSNSGNPDPLSPTYPNIRPDHESAPGYEYPASAPTSQNDNQDNQNSSPSYSGFFRKT